MKYLNKITNVSGYSILDKHIYVFTVNGILQKYGNSVLWECSIDTQYFLLNVSDELLCTYSQFRKVVLINKETGEISTEKVLSFKPLRVFDERILGVNIKKGTDENIFSLCSLNSILFEEELFSTKNFIPINIDTKFCYCQFGYNLISIFDISDGTELWQKEFSNNIQKLEVWEEKVVLVATHGNYITTLYALDAETGNTIWESREMSADIKIIDNKIYTTAINHTSIKLVELNPLDVSQSVEYDLTKIIFNELGKTENFKYTIQNRLIYISVISRKILLVIDFLKSELLWRYDFTPPAQPRTYWIDEPKVSGNRLYVMDEENTLHIF